MLPLNNSQSIIFDVEITSGYSKWSKAFGDKLHFTFTFQAVLTAELFCSIEEGRVEWWLYLAYFGSRVVWLNGTL